MCLFLKKKNKVIFLLKKKRSEIVSMYVRTVQTAHYKLNGVGDVTKLKLSRFAFGYQGSVFGCVSELMSSKGRNRCFLKEVFKTLNKKHTVDEDRGPSAVCKC